MATSFTLDVANPAPVAGDGTAATDEDSTVTGSVAALAADPDGDALSFTLVTPPATGTLTMAADGSYVFDPAGGFEGLAVGETATVSFTYRTEDGEGGSATGNVVMTVTGVNDAPVTGAAIATQSVSDGDTVSLDVSGNFSDPDGDTLSYAASGLPAGLVIDPATGVISGTIDGSASVDGPYTVTVTATDPHGGAVASSFSFEVANPAPVALDGTGTTDEDSPLAGTVSSDVTDVDGDSLSYALVTPPAAGTLTFNPDGSYLFDPSGAFDHLGTGETSTVEFTYDVSDGEGGVDRATVTLTITGTNDAPVVGALIGGKTGSDGEPFTLDVSGNFSDPEGDVLSFSASGLPAGLTIDPATGVISGTIDGSASVDGPYTVTITATDPEGGAVATSFTLDVANTVPVASDGSNRTNEDSPVTGSVADDVTDADADTLSYTLLTEPTNGDLTFNADGSYIFDPAGSFEHLALGESQTVTFSYEVDDGEGGKDTANVTLTISGENDAPVVARLIDPVEGHDNKAMEIDISGHFSDIDGTDTLSFAATGLPPGLSIDPATGVISGTIDNLAYVDGPYSVTITVTDPHGATVSTNFSFVVRPDPASFTREPAPVADLPEPESHERDTSNDIAVPGVVVDTVSEISDLHSSADALGVKGVVVQAVNGVRPLTGLSDLGDTPVLAEIRALELLQQQAEAFTTLLDIDLGGDNAETLRGFSLRLGVAPNDVLDPGRIASELAFDTLADDRTIIFEVSERQFDGGSASISGLSATLPDGRPLPSWVQNVGNGTFLIEKPTNVEALDIKIRAILSDGSIVETPLKIELENGQISAAKPSAERAEAKPFTTQLAEAAEAGDQEAEELIAALTAAQ